MNFEYPDAFGSEINSLINQLDVRIKNPEWVNQLESQQLWQRTELKRIGFLLATVAHLAQQDPASLGKIDQAELVRQVNDFLSNPEATSTQFRTWLMALESKLDERLDTGVSERDRLVLQTREKIGLALGGGGAFGLSHVGVLKVFQEQGIPINMLAGGSMGALVGSVASAFIDEQGQISREGVDYMIAIARELKYIDQLREKRGDQTILPLDKLLNAGGWTYEKVIARKGGIPVFAQVRNLDNGQTEFLSPQPEDSIADSLLVARASTAIKKVLGLDPVKIRETTYADDTAVLAVKSTDTAVDKLRQEGATTVIDVPISTVDFPGLQWTKGAQKSDVRVKTLDERGFWLTTLSNGWQFYANNAEDEQKLYKTAIKTEDFLAVGESSARKALPAILAQLGLQKITDKRTRSD